MKATACPKESYLDLTSGLANYFECFYPRGVNVKIANCNAVKMYYNLDL